MIKNSSLRIRSENTKFLISFSDLPENKYFANISNPKVLKALSEQNIKTGIVTSKTKEELLNDFVPFGLMNYLSYAICADDTVEHKPAPEPILKFLELANVCPDQAVYIGDTRYDMECAQAAGVDFALALWGSKNPALEAKYKLDHPKSILRLLQKV